MFLSFIVVCLFSYAIMCLSWVIFTISCTIQGMQKKLDELSEQVMPDFPIQQRKNRNSKENKDSDVSDVSDVSEDEDEEAEENDDEEGSSSSSPLKLKLDCPEKNNNDEDDTETEIDENEIEYLRHHFNSILTDFYRRLSTMEADIHHYLDKTFLLVGFEPYTGMPVYITQEEKNGQIPLRPAVSKYWDGNGRVPCKLTKIQFSGPGAASSFEAYANGAEEEDDYNDLPPLYECAGSVSAFKDTKDE